MGWEIYKRARWRSSTDPTVTLSTFGKISLNVAIIKTYMEDNRYAVLMYDRDRSMVGIRFVKNSDPTTYPVFENKVKSSAWINASAFLKNYNIIPDTTASYSANYDKKSKLLTFSVDRK